MLGVELSARFALPPNSRAYCGTPEFRKAFSDFLKERSARNRMALEGALKKFTAHYAYLELIANASKLRPFDEKVAEALWLGNGLLEEVKKESVAKLIENEFSGPGLLSASRAHKLAAAIPEGFVPHHSFHVLYLHTISGVVSPSLANADACRVSWGKVIGRGDDEVTVKTQKLAKVNGRLALAECRKKWKTSCAGINLVPDAEIGDIVASHWGFAVMKISHKQAKRLEKCTEQNIGAANTI
jgi:hydrogenase maturation factor